MQYLNKFTEETGDGGDYVFQSGDLLYDRGLKSAIYYKLFSGSGYWANSAFDINIESETSKVLFGNDLSNKGLQEIKTAVGIDLQEFEGAGEFTVEASTPSNDRVNIDITLNGSETFNFSFTFDDN